MPPKTVDAICKEQKIWDRKLVLLRESALIWLDLIGKVSDEQLRQVEQGMREVARGYWGIEAALQIDPEGRSLSISHPDGRSLDLLTGEMSEWLPHDET